MSTTEWPKITANVSETFCEELGDCWQYTRGSTKLLMTKRGTIFVKPGDSLSQYSWVLYGDFKQLHVFCRYKNGQKIEIQNKNLIYYGEDIYHKPTVEDHDKRVRGIRERRDNPPRPTFTQTRPPSYSDALRDAVFGIVVTAVAIDDDVTETAAKMALDEVRFDSIPSFVDQVIAKAGGRKIRRLHVYAHGHLDAWDLGNDKLMASNFARHQPELARLRDHLTPHGWVIMHSCLVGKALPLLRYLRSVWNVHVIAGIGLQWDIAASPPGNFAVRISEFNEIGYQVVKATGEEYTRTFFPPSLKDTLKDSVYRKTRGMFF